MGTFSWATMGAAIALGDVWFGPLEFLALISGNNLFYMLCPPKNLREPLAFLGRGWSIVAHVVLALFGLLYVACLVYVVSPLLNAIVSTLCGGASRMFSTKKTKRMQTVAT